MRIFSPNVNGYRGDHFQNKKDRLEVIPATLIETPEQHLETYLGQAVLSGELDVSGALTALDQYEQWVDDGEPKFGGTTTVAPSVQTRISHE